MANDLHTKGDGALATGKFEEAIQHYSDGIQLTPENHLLYSNRSLSYASLRKYEQVLEDAKRTVELKPDWWIGYRRLGDAYQCLGKHEEAIDAREKGLKVDVRNVELTDHLAIVAEKAGKLEEAIKYASDAINLTPNNHVLFSSRSFWYASLQKYEQALEDAKKTVELKPDWWKGYRRLGDAYQGLGKHEEAIDAYKKGLEFDVTNVDLRDHLPLMAEKAGKLEEAIKYEADCIRCIFDRFAPNNHLLYSNRSFWYVSLGKYEHALEYAKKTVELKPDWWKGYRRLGDAYQGLGKHQEAIDAWKKGLEYDVTNVGLRIDIGIVAEKEGKLEEAIKYASDAINLAPNNHFLYSNRSLWYASLRKYEQALEDAKKTVELKPDWWKGYRRLGDAYQGLGKYEEAIDACKKGLEFDVSNVELRDHLAVAAGKAGKLEEAIKYASDAINLASNNHLRYSNRSFWYASLQKYEQALEDAKKTIELNPDGWIGYSRLGYAATKAGKLEEAIRYASDAINLLPSNHLLYSYRSLWYASLKKYEQALEDAKKTVELKPDWWRGYARLGYAYNLLGKDVEASDAWKKGLEVDSTNELLKSCLAIAESSLYDYIMDSIINFGYKVGNILTGAVKSSFLRTFFFFSNQIKERKKRSWYTSSDPVSTDFMVTTKELKGARVATKLNDYIYELYKPTEQPDMDIVLVHGLQLDGTDNLHLSTWISGNVGSYHAWPKTWLAEDFHRARVLTVAYDSHLYQTAEQGNIDLHNTAENLMNCLLLLELLEEGDALSCRPLVLVGYSFGGILIKQLCLHAFWKRFAFQGPQFQSFLNRIRAIYFMGTPHMGMIHEGFGLIGQENASPLFKDVELLNKALARLHDSFDDLQEFYAWHVSGIGEEHETRWGTFQAVLVPEGSARYGEPFSTVQADHISLSKPTAKSSVGYKQLEALIKQAYKGKKVQTSCSYHGVRGF